MDMMQHAVSETAVIDLKGPDDEPLLDEDKKPKTVTVYGPGSKQYAKASTARNNRLVDKLKKKGKTDTSSDEAARETAEFLAACTKELSPNIRMGDLEGDALIKALYSEPKLGYIAEQVGKFLGDWGNFSKGSSKS